MQEQLNYDYNPHALKEILSDRPKYYSVNVDMVFDTAITQCKNNSVTPEDRRENTRNALGYALSTALCATSVVVTYSQFFEYAPALLKFASTAFFTTLGIASAVRTGIYANRATLTEEGALQKTKDDLLVSLPGLYKAPNLHHSDHINSEDMARGKYEEFAEKAKEYCIAKIDNGETITPDTKDEFIKTVVIPKLAA